MVVADVDFWVDAAIAEPGAERGTRPSEPVSIGHRRGTRRSARPGISRRYASSWASCLERTGGTIMRGNLEKRGLPAPFRSAVLAFLLVGGLLLLMLFCGWLYAGTSGAVITTVLGVIALMLVRKVSPQFFLLLGGARSIDPEDMPALFGIIAGLCRRAGIAQVP